MSLFALGSMTWGSQNDEAEAHALIDCALDHGVNLIDTAEMYPTTPLRAETSGDTERIIGSWLARTGRRGDVVIATKIAGAGNRSVGRGGEPIAPASLRRAIEGSLRRLRTDHVDLYQLHWPNRGSYHFRQGWSYDPSRQRKGEADDLRAILETLGALVAEGKLRHVGLSNDTAWGAMTCLRLAERHGLPRVIAIQNEWSLLNRHFDLDLAEICHHEEIGLLAYLAPRRRPAHRQVRGRGAAAGIARHHQRRPRRTHQPALGPRHHRLCRAGAPAPARSRPDGARLRRLPAVHGGGAGRRHQPRPAPEQPRRRRADAGARADRGHRRRAPPPPDAALIRGRRPQGR